MVVNGWTLLVHDGIAAQLEKLSAEAERARKANPEGFRSNTNVKLLAAIGKLMLEEIPSDPTRPEYRQGNTLGRGNRHWFRAKFFQRFRLFFRYDTKAQIIVYAWVNDEDTLRKEGSKTDAYAVFAKMLESGNPPTSWSALMASCRAMSETLLAPRQKETPKPAVSHTTGLHRRKR